MKPWYFSSMIEIASKNEEINSFFIFCNKVHELSNCKDGKCEIGIFVGVLGLVFADPLKTYDEQKEFFISHCGNFAGVLSLWTVRSFHPDSNLDKVVIFRSFQQTAEEIYDLSHFRHEHVPFFDTITFYQIKDAAAAVLARKKSTSIAELFSVELKFTIDTLNNWFKNKIKENFLELNDIKKQIFIKENPIVPSKTICCVGGFLLDIESSGENERWYDFIVEREHLFIRNIYS